TRLASGSIECNRRRQTWLRSPGHLAEDISPKRDVRAVPCERAAHDQRAIAEGYLNPRKTPSGSALSANSQKSMFEIERLFSTPHASDGVTRNVRPNSPYCLFTSMTRIGCSTFDRAISSTTNRNDR